MASRKLERVERGIYRRGSGYVAIYQGPDGRPKKRAARTLEEARRLRRNAQTDVDRGDHPIGDNPFLPAYVEAWLETYSGRTERGIRPETRDEYRRDLNRYANAYFARTRIREIDALSLKAFARWVALGLRPNERGTPTRALKKNTVRLAVAPLRLVLATAAEEGLISRNPAGGIRLPLDLGDRHRTEQGQDQDEEGLWDVRALSDTQAKALLKAIEKQENAREKGDPMLGIDGLLLAELVLATGARISEACGWEWQHFRPEEGRIQVKQRYREGNLSVPKSRFSRRVIPLTPELVAKLKARRKAATYGADGDPIFTTLAGHHRRGSELLKKIMRPAADSIDLDWVGWHTLRHTCASMMFRHGANAKQVQAVLGHHSPAFTLATYVHLMDDDLPVNGWAAALSPGAPGLRKAA